MFMKVCAGVAVVVAVAYQLYRFKEPMFVRMGAGVAALLVAYQLYRIKQQSNRRRRLQGQKMVRLLPAERNRMSLIFMSPATSSITFFTGSLDQARKHLEKRITSIVAANPWLNATLDHDPSSGEIALFYQPGHAAQSIFSAPKQLQISRGDSYPTIVKKLQPFLCRTSEDSVGRCIPLFRVLLVADHADPGKFAVVVSANHVLMDGHGFYRVSKMLSSQAVVESLQIKRDQTIPARIEATLGGDLGSSAAIGFIIRFVYHKIVNALSPRTQTMGFYLNEEWIRAEKQRAAKSGEVPFVSTNDVATSTICNAIACDCAYMAINFRGRLEGCHDDLIGNYEELLVYFRQDFATPALIRQSISPDSTGVLMRAGKPKQELFSNLKHLFGGPTFAGLTNWVRFAFAFHLPGATEDLHLPIRSRDDTLARMFSMVVIFRAQEGRVAAYVDGTQQTLDRLRSSDIVGDPLGVKGL